VLKGGSRHRRVLEIGTLVTCVLMVLVSAAVIIDAQGRSQRSDVDKRMGATSALAAAYVDEQTTGLRHRLTQERLVISPPRDSMQSVDAPSNMSERFVPDGHPRPTGRKDAHSSR